MARFYVFLLLLVGLNTALQAQDPLWVKYGRGEIRANAVQIETDHSGNLLISATLDRTGVTIGDSVFTFTDLDYEDPDPFVQDQFQSRGIYPTLRVNVRDSLLGISRFFSWQQGNVPVLVANPANDGFFRAGRVVGVGQPEAFDPASLFPGQPLPHAPFNFNLDDLTDQRSPLNGAPQQGVVFAFDADMEEDYVPYEFGRFGGIPFKDGISFFDVRAFAANTNGDYSGTMTYPSDVTNQFETICFFYWALVDQLFEVELNSGVFTPADAGRVEIRHAAVTEDAQFIFGGGFNTTIPPYFNTASDNKKQSDVIIWEEVPGQWNHVLQGVDRAIELNDLVLVEDKTLYAFCTYGDLSFNVPGFFNNPLVILENVQSTPNAIDTLYDTGLEAGRPLIAKFDTAGNFLRFDTLTQMAMHDASITQAEYIADSGQFLIAGFVRGGFLEFANGERIEPFYPTGIMDEQYFVARIDTNYNLLWHAEMGSGDYGGFEINDVAWGPQGVAYVAGHLGSEVSLNWGGVLLTSGNSNASFSENFVLALGDSSLLQDAPVTARTPQAAALNTQLYPNPAQGSFTVQLNAPLVGTGQVTVYSALGQEIATQAMTNPRTRIQTEAWPTGVYHVVVTANGAQQTHRLLVR